jgi:DnaJ-class molecular chaperone
VRGDVHVLVDVRVPSRLTARQRELLELLSAEFGEEDADEAVDAGGQGTTAADAAPGEQKRNRAARRRERRLRDRLRDAIS